MPIIKIYVLKQFLCILQNKVLNVYLDTYNLITNCNCQYKN